MMAMDTAMALAEALNILDLPAAPRMSVADALAVEAVEQLAALEAITQEFDNL